MNIYFFIFFKRFRDNERVSLGFKMGFGFISYVEFWRFIVLDFLYDFVRGVCLF